ncbi:HVO_0758 family zinc finger protein [Halobacterium sp. KA-4]|uniref:HVO_0758 family zinc finger protein n=1 Tax=Halobacterium sp. KA-4 TaxID=2896367 RepID=UPI002E7ABB7D|nr:HVO_0758 family zinc finger protein [Halobacterium sp. KA-4]
MDSIRRALREGEIKKDMYERLECAECDEQLVTKNEPDEVGSIRACPECGQEWRQLP